jgi:hypothetical protein
MDHTVAFLTVHTELLPAWGLCCGGKVFVVWTVDLLNGDSRSIDMRHIDLLDQMPRAIPQAA